MRVEVEADRTPFQRIQDTIDAVNKLGIGVVNGDVVWADSDINDSGEEVVMGESVWNFPEQKKLHCYSKSLFLPPTGDTKIGYDFIFKVKNSFWSRYEKTGKEIIDSAAFIK